LPLQPATNKQEIQCINETFENINMASQEGFFDFLGLPFELRLQIYRYCVPTNTIFELDKNGVQRPSWMQRNDALKEKIVKFFPNWLSTMKFEDTLLETDVSEHSMSGTNEDEEYDSVKWEEFQRSRCSSYDSDFEDDVSDSGETEDNDSEDHTPSRSSLLCSAFEHSMPDIVKTSSKNRIHNDIVRLDLFESSSDRNSSDTNELNYDLLKTRSIGIDDCDIEDDTTMEYDATTKINAVHQLIQYCNLPAWKRLPPSMSSEFQFVCQHDWVPKLPYISALPGLLQVSRQISEEALNVLYGDNLFLIDLWLARDWDLNTGFYEANWKRVRHVMLLNRMIWQQPQPFTMATCIWDCVCPRLITLAIVGQQPLAELWSETTVDIWTNGFIVMLKCVSASLSPNAQVLADIDEAQAPDKLMAKHLTHSYRHVRSNIGDRLLRRGAYDTDDEWLDSSDDDSWDFSYNHLWNFWENDFGLIP
jgi:hypothetical protein